MKKLIAVIVLGLFFYFREQPTHAFTIHVTYDSSVTNLANAAQVETAFAYAAQQIQNLYTNPITVNLTVYWGNTGLGQSTTHLYGFSYSDVLAALAAKRKSAADFSAYASLPATDPTGSDNWYIPFAQIKALGGLSALDPNDPGEDGSITFASNKSFTFDPNNRAVSGKFDFIAVAEHEITEVLGRLSSLGDVGGGYVPFDLFRFTASGVRNFTNPNGPGVYFSVDNGATVLKTYNNASQNGGDPQDWATSVPPDACDAFSGSGTSNTLSSVDIITLDIMGYDLAAVAPTSPRLVSEVLSNGAVHFSFTNTPSLSFTVVGTTNLTFAHSNWTVLGTAAEGPSGFYQFTDPQQATNRNRYYGVRSP